MLEKLEKIQSEYDIPPDNIRTVSAINNYLSHKFQTDDRLAEVYILGEVSNVFCSSAQHLFFDLKDDRAKISCVIFDSSQEQLQLLQDGKEVLVRGRIDYYERDGKASVKPDKIYPIGEGLLWQTLRKRITKLRQQGLFKPEHKKPTPQLPDKIGIVTSKDGDALHDMVNSIHGRHPNVDIYVYHASVQGDTAAEQLQTGIQFFDSEYPVDVILLGRGGGSMEDLMAFNDEALAHTIYAAETPIITGVGHREDETIAGYTADHQAITPTAAGKRAVANLQDLQEQLDTLHRQLQDAYQRFLKIKQQEATIKRGRQLETKYKIAIAALILLIILLILAMVIL